MTPFAVQLSRCPVSYGVGLLGSLVGVGGGITILPLLTLLLGVDIHHTIAACIISVLATSNGSASAYVREHISNLRLAMFLEIATSAGALSGAFLAGVISPRWLLLLFGPELIPFTCSFHRFIHDLYHFKGQALIIAGPLLLIATHVTCVAISIVAFAFERDWTYVVITEAVYSLLRLSFMAE